MDKPKVKGGRPPLGHRRLVAFVPEEFHRKLRLESFQRGVTLGDLIQEAFRLRTVLTKREP